MGNRVKIVIKGVSPWDGEYELPEGLAFKNTECHRIKQICDVRAGDLIDALEAGDAGAYVAVAAVAIDRTGVKVDLNDLWQAEIGCITIDARADGPPTPSVDEGAPSETESSSGVDFEAAGV